MIKVNIRQLRILQDASTVLCQIGTMDLEDHKLLSEASMKLEQLLRRLEDKDKADEPLPW